MTALSNITIKDSTSGFFLDDRFYGFSYAVGTTNSGVVRLYNIDVDDGGDMSIDLSTLTLQDETGSDTTPVAIEDRAALLNTYVSKKKIGSGGGGAAFIPNQYRFANAAARDAYFTTNFSELRTGLQIVLIDNGAGQGVIQSWIGANSPASYPASPGTLWSILQTITAQEIASLYESIADVNRYNNVDKGKVDSITNTGRGQIITAGEAAEIDASINSASISGQTITFTKNDGTTFDIVITQSPLTPPAGGVIPSGTPFQLQIDGDSWDASTGAFPSGGDRGFAYKISNPGTVDNQPFTTNDLILQVVDSASSSVYAGNWVRIDGDRQVHSWAGLNDAIDDTQIEAVLTRLGYQKGATGNETPSLHEFSISTISARVDLNTDLNVQQTINFNVTNHSRLNSLIVEADPVTPGTFITVGTMTVPTTDGIQSQQVTLSGLVTSTDRTINFRLKGTDTASTEYLSNTYQVSVRNLVNSEFAYYGVRSTNDFATIPENDLSTELTPVDVTNSGRSYTIDEAGANGSILGILSPDNRDPVSIVDPLGQPALSGFTSTPNVRTINSVTYNLLTLTNNSGFDGTFNYAVTTE